MKVLNILVTFALDAEFAPWRQLRGFRKMAGDSFPAYGTRIGDADVRVALSGVGSENARRVLRQALAISPDVCILSGFAGSLKPAYRLGDILAAMALRDVRGERLLRCDASLLRAAGALGAKPAPVLLTTDQVILTSESKREFSSVADAADMESFACMVETAVRNIPTLALRAISDGVDEDLPLDFNSVLDERGRIHSWRLAGQMARAPQRLPALLRLGRQSRRAAQSLAHFLDSYVQRLSAEVKTFEAAVEVACG